MINLKVRKKFFIYSIWRNVITVLFSLPTIIYTLIVLVSSWIRKDNNFELNQMNLLFLSLPPLSINIFFIIFGAFLQRKLQNQLIYEFYEIVSLVKLPDVLPKVVYVYTCHNDLYEARVLQNAQQTYKNIEIWISEGSASQEVINKTKCFAIQNNFHFFAVGGSGSSNKADNLNAFLTKSGANFDYLLIADSDEVINAQFVEFAIRCFYSNKLSNLGFVSTWNYYYFGNNLFTNVMSNYDNIEQIKDIEKNYTNGAYPNLYSACSLISKKLINLNGNLFPFSCAEDYAMESFALRNGFTNVMLPIAPCAQLFDKSIKAYQNRTLRVNDWCIKLLKEDKFNLYNEKYAKWWKVLIRRSYQPLMTLIMIVSVSLLIWLFIYFNNYIFSHPLIMSSLCFLIFTVLLSFICTNLVKTRAIKYGNKFTWLFIILAPFFMIALMPYKLKNWFKSFVLGKYSTFGGSGQTSKKKTKWQLLKWDLILLIIFSSMLITISIIFAAFVGFNNIYLDLLYIFLSIIVGIFALSFLLEILFFIIGGIPNNKSYSKNNFVFTPESFKFKNIKHKFINDHLNDNKFDLSIFYN